MHTILPTRKARFKSAVARVGVSQAAWCAKNGVDYMHLYYTVLKDDTDALLSKVDEFIEHVESQVAA